MEVLISTSKFILLNFSFCQLGELHRQILEGYIRPESKEKFN